MAAEAAEAAEVLDAAARTEVAAAAVMTVAMTMIETMTTMIEMMMTIEMPIAKASEMAAVMLSKPQELQLWRPRTRAHQEHPLHAAQTLSDRILHSLSRQQTPSSTAARG